MIIPNGQINGVRVIPDGRRRVRLEMLTRDPEAVQAAIQDVAGSVAGAGGPWDGPPRVVVRDGQGGLSRLIVALELEAARDGAAEAWLADAIAARAGDLLVGRPLAIPEAGR